MKNKNENEFSSSVNIFLTETVDTEVAESIVNDFLRDQKINRLLSPEFQEDTLTSAIATFPTPFKAVGQLAPEVLGKQKKKKKKSKDGLDLGTITSILGGL